MSDRHDHATPAPESVPPLTSMPLTVRETQRPVSAATPGQAARLELESAVGDAVAVSQYHSKGPRHSQCPACAPRIASILAAVDTYVAAQEPHAAPELTARLAETEGQFAQAESFIDDYRAALTAMQPAPELAAAMRESRLRAEVITEILDAFSPSGSGHTARVGMVQIAKWRTRAGLTS